MAIPFWLVAEKVLLPVPTLTEPFKGSQLGLSVTVPDDGVVTTADFRPTSAFVPVADFKNVEVPAT